MIPLGFALDLAEQLFLGFSASAIVASIQSMYIQTFPYIPGLFFRPHPKVRLEKRRLQI